MDTRKLKAHNFSPEVKTWSLERFNNAFSGVYPESELTAIALELGIKPEVTKVTSDAYKPGKRSRAQDKPEDESGDMKNVVAIDE